MPAPEVRIVMSSSSATVQSHYATPARGRSDLKLFRIRHASAAIAMLAFALTACAPSDPVEQAQELFQSGDREAALALMQAAVEADPDDQRLMHHYGALLLRSGKSARAVWPLRAAARNAEWREESERLLLKAHFDGANFYDAKELANEILERSPDDVEVLSHRARAHLNTHDEVSAIADFDHLLELRPNDPALMESKLQALLRLERADEAELQLAELRALVAELENPPARLPGRLCALDAVFTKERGDLEAAEALFVGCLQEYPDHSRVISEAIAFYDDQDRGEEGTAVLRVALETSPKMLELRDGLATRLRMNGQSSAAEQLLRDGTELHGTPQAWSLLVEHYVAVGDLTAARDALQDAYRSEQIGPDATDELLFGAMPEEHLFVLGDILAQLGENERVETIVGLLGESAYRDFLRARVLFESGRYQEALDQYAEGFRLWPGNPGARFLAGQAAEQVGDFRLAVIHYRESMRSDTAATKAALFLARIRISQGRTSGAEEALSGYFEGHRNDAESIRLYARLLMELGRADKASNARGVLAERPGYYDAAVADQAHDLAVRMGADAALAFLADSTQKLESPPMRESFAVWSEVLALQGRDDEALARIDEAIATAPEDASLYAIRGMTLARAGRVVEAQLAFEKSTEFEPGDHRALIEVAKLRKQEGDALAAVALYDRAAAVMRDWDDAGPRLAAGVMLLTATSDAEAQAEGERRLRAILVDYPSYGPAAAVLARRAFEQGDTSDATLALATRGAQFQPDIEAVETLGRIQLTRGDYAEAARAFRWALEKGSEHGDTQVELGRALAALGDLAGARSAFEDALANMDGAEQARVRSEIAKLDRSAKEM
jgi:Flp pilus assembly protein TadD